MAKDKKKRLSFDEKELYQTRELLYYAIDRLAWLYDNGKGIANDETRDAWKALGAKSNQLIKRLDKVIK